MKEYVVDFSGVRDIDSLHQRLQDALSLPPWYGKNLDALYDALTEFAVPARIRLLSWQDLPEDMQGYFAKLRLVLGDARAETPGLIFSMEESAEPEPLDPAAFAEEDMEAEVPDSAAFAEEDGEPETLDPAAFAEENTEGEMSAPSFLMEEDTEA